MMTFRSRIFDCLVFALALACVWGAMSGCTPAPAKLDLQFYYIPDERGKQTYENIKVFQIAMQGSGVTSDGQQTQFAPGTAGLILPDVSCDTQSKGNVEVQVDVVGFSDEQSTRPSYSGRQIKFLRCGRPLSLPIFISPINAFAPLTGFDMDSKTSNVTQSTERMAGHQVVSLPDGRVLFTGGANLTDAGVVEGISDGTSIFDPTTGIFEKGPDMSSPRAFHTLTRVERDGVIYCVAVGGLRSAGPGALEPVRSIDVFTVNADGLVERNDGPLLNEGRAFHTATVTPQKNILIYGGFKWQPGAPDPKEVVKSAGSWEILNFSSGGDLLNNNQGALTGQMPRGMHTATLLAGNNKILIIGGAHADSTGINTLDSFLEVTLNPDETGLTASPTADKLKSKRAGHTATFIQDGQFLLIVGGMETDPTAFNPLKPKTVHKTMDLFNSTGSLQSNFNVSLQAPRVFHTTSRLQDNRVLVVGGLSSATTMNGKAEIYLTNATSGLQDQPLLIDQLKNRFHHSGTVLLNGSLLIFGGATLSNDPTSTPYVSLDKGDLFNPGPPR